MLNNSTMGDFTKYLAESHKQYDYRIKIAGEIDKDFANKLETGLQKFEVAKLSAGKSTPIQETPLDFPQFKNTNVTIFELTTNYPASVFELAEYVANYMGLAKNQVVVRKPGEPTEQYQADMNVVKEKDFKSVLQDVEYKDAPQHKGEDIYGDKANASLLKELLKDRKEKQEFAAKEKDQEHMSKEEKGTPSPLSKSTNPHPDPKRK
jgi:hypothetical protein